MEVLLKEYGIRIELKENDNFQDFLDRSQTNKVLKSTPKKDVEKYIKSYFNKYQVKKSKNDNSGISKEPKKSKSKKDL